VKPHRDPDKVVSVPSNPQLKTVEKFTAEQDRLVLQAADLSLETIAAMVESGAIDIEPGYQRRARWSAEKQSALIESFLLNVPVPPVYLAEEDYGTYSVIDGKQRITAIHAFMRGTLELKALQSFSELNEATITELPRELVNALTVRPYIRAVTLLKQSDPELKYEVFARLNTGGVALNAQEIRNVAYRGPLNDLVYKLAEDSFLRRQLKIRGEHSTAYNAMLDAEFVVRFLTLLEVWQTFSGDFRKSMDEFMQRYRDADQHQLDHYRDAFEHSIAACEQLWSSHAFQRPDRGGWRDQALAGMFDAQMIATSFYSKTDIQQLASKQAQVLSRTRDLFTDPDFDSAVRVGTNTPSRVRLRVQLMVDALGALV
jgi:hypothetical protein